MLREELSVRNVLVLNMHVCSVRLAQSLHHRVSIFQPITYGKDCTMHITAGNCANNVNMAASTSLEVTIYYVYVCTCMWISAYVFQPPRAVSISLLSHRLRGSMLVTSSPSCSLWLLKTTQAEQDM